MNVVQMRQLGRFGGWGNQLFQYAFAKWYARTIGARLEIPIGWVGRSVLQNVEAGPIGRHLESVTEDESTGMEAERANINLCGYFIVSFCNSVPLEESRRDVAIKPQLVESLGPVDRDFWALHLRRGDFFKAGFAVVSDASFDRLLERERVPSAKVRRFGDGFGPVPGTKQCPFIGDFIHLMMADTMVRSNSTFSWWAGNIGRCRVFNPVIKGGPGFTDCEFVEGKNMWC